MMCRSAASTRRRMSTALFGIPTAATRPSPSITTPYGVRWTWNRLLSAVALVAPTTTQPGRGGVPTADEAGAEDDFDAGNAPCQWLDQGRRRKPVTGNGHCEPTRCAHLCGGCRDQKETLPRQNGELELPRVASRHDHQLDLRQKCLVKRATSIHQKRFERPSTSIYLTVLDRAMGSRGAG
jgi:hypothetical protein